MSGSILLEEAKSVLDDLKRMHKRLSIQKNKLLMYDGWTLSVEGKKKSSHTYYDVKRPGDVRSGYLGNENNEHVLNVKRFKYADMALKIIADNIKILETLINQYISPEYLEINKRLPIRYQTEIKSSFTSQTAGISMPPEAVLWEQKLEAEKAKYPPYKPEQLKQPTLKGIYVRSKSEALIANILYTVGIPFVYELPIFINGEMLLPDFRILSLIDLESEFIIEHQGMIFDDDYADKFIRSLRLYLHSEWIPNKNRKRQV